MDLYAYANIGNLSAIASANGIYVPRLRGYRLMAMEEPITKKELEEEIRRQQLYEVEAMFREIAPGFYEHSQRTRRLVRRYMVLDGDGYFPTGVRWDRLHGKRRKKAKFRMKKVAKEVSSQYGVFNKYCGREDVLYIHARIGGDNWLFFGGDKIEKEPWFIEKIDHAFDSTYCDIYARIDPPKEEET